MEEDKSIDKSRKMKATGIEDLICNILRGIHTDKMEKSNLQNYIYMTGVALHNIPHNIADNRKLSDYQIIEINNLDPTGNNDTWGDWVKCVLDSFDQPLPLKKPEFILKNNKIRKLVKVDNYEP